MTAPKLTDLNKFILPVILLGVVVYFIWKNGKKAGLTIIPDVPYIDDQGVMTKNFNPNTLAEELFDVMDGLFTLSGTKDATFRKLYELPTDNMVIAVYNAFNTKYGSKGSGSLTKWISDEAYYNYGLGYKDKAIKRLKSLRLQ
ncbi:hypothetical protein [Pedobacter jeongneungensis]|uniref:hypothetical protein n=1 Tax=Pedobacter jeongneungensis TaxID=947309 RepID=UPI0004682336|nr:hypothetical protein [Pedobacter jeongneungensis]